MKKLHINIFTRNLVWIGMVEEVETFIHRTSWHEVSTSELRVSKTAQGVDELQVGRILIVNDQKDKALIIDDLTASLNDNYITFNLTSIKALLNYRICHPADSGSFISLTQSEVMMRLVEKNLVTQTRDVSRYFWKSDGTKNMLTVAPIKFLGSIIDFVVDWKTGNLGEAITSIAKMNATDAEPLGWNIVVTEDLGAFEMNVWEARQKHINQTTLPPVIFSEEFGHLKNATYENSIKEWKNSIYVFWNDGAADQVNLVEEIADISSFDRREMIIESSKETANQVTVEGRSELNKRPKVESFTGEIINNDRTMSTYKEDWQLGDIVTIQSKEVLKGKVISLDAQITEIEEIYDSGEYSINATFGKGKLSLVELIKNAIEQKK
jgi:hypothetical protein